MSSTPQGWRAGPNRSLNRTLRGMSALGFISFFPKSVMPFRAGYLER